MINEEQQEYRATGTEFKHEDTTQVMRIRFIAGNRFPIYPTEGHKFVAKVGDVDGNYTGDYPVSVSGSSFEIKSSDLKGLDSGNYRLEVWESYVDSEGNTQVGIFPSPQAFVSFTINKNIEDTAWDLAKDISFQDLVNTAVVAAGQNITVAATNTLPAGSQASVTQKYENGKNEFTFSIPEGLKGDPGRPFSIAKVFPSKDTMNGDGLSEGDFVMIASNVNDPNNATLFTWTGSEFKEIADLSGAPGVQGPQGPEGQQGPKGDKGDTGATGSQGDPGKDGYTPVRGTDYWTNADKQSIYGEAKQYVDDATSLIARININLSGHAADLDAIDDDVSPSLIFVAQDAKTFSPWVGAASSHVPVDGRKWLVFSTGKKEIRKWQLALSDNPIELYSRCWVGDHWTDWEKLGG